LIFKDTHWLHKKNIPETEGSAGSPMGEPAALFMPQHLQLERTMGPNILLIIIPMGKCICPLGRTAFDA
jgi:hypothetical protein